MSTLPHALPLVVALLVPISAAAADADRRLDNPVATRAAAEIRATGVKDAIEAEKIAAQDAGLLWFRNGFSLRPPPGLDPALAAPPQGIALLQFSGRIEKEWLEAVAALGIVVDDHVENYALLADVPAKAAGGLVDLLDRGILRYVGPYPAEAKVDKALDLAGGAGERVVVQFFGEPDEALLASVGGLLAIEHVAGDPLPFVRGVAGAKEIAALAHLERVKWIERYDPGRMHNIEAAMATGADYVNGAGPYSGAGIRVAVDDSGIARTGPTSQCVFLDADYHPDIAAWRIADEWDFFNNDDNACDDVSHGTHTSGTLGGDGTLLNTWMGIAPGVTFLIYKDVGPDTGFAHFEQVLSRAAAHDADISGNSWGGGNGIYTTNSQLADRAVLGDWNGSDGIKQYMFVSVSGGNDNDLVTAPGTGKNIVTVGATKDGNCADGFACWGVHGCMNHPACPCIFNDTCGDTYWPADQRVCFSNYGPVDTDGDGHTRIKPDLVAPGTHIFSLAAPYMHPTGDYYQYMDGTSMAQPIVAGTAALMLEAYPVIRNWPEMTKARLLATATPIGSSSWSGHGMVDALHAVYSTATFSTQLWEGGSLSATGNEVDYSFTVPAGTQEVRVYLAWSDRPSSTTEVVNDLDLRVYDASGTEVGSSASYDDTVEWVRLAGGTPGTWRANIRGFNIPQPVVFFGIYAGVEILPRSLSMNATPDSACVRPGGWLEITSTLTNSGHSAAASEQVLDLPDTDGLFTLYGVEMPTADPGRSHVYTSAEIKEDTAANKFSLFTGEVDASIPRSATWSIAADPFMADGSFALYTYGTAHGHIYYGDMVSVTVDGTPPLDPWNLVSTTHPSGTCRNQDDIWMAWDAPPDGGCGLDGFGIAWGYGAPVMPAASKVIEETQTVYHEIKTGSTTPWYFSVRTVDNAGNWSGGYSAYGPMWVDVTPPGAVSWLASETHPAGACTANTTLAINWGHAPDDNCGTVGYNRSLTSGAPSMPPASQTLPYVDHMTERVPPAHSPWFFNIRALDAAGNWATTYATHGPIWVDPIPPEVGGLLVERAGNDLNFLWSGVPGADWYHLRRSTQPWFPAWTLVGGDLPAAAATEINGALDTEPIVYYEVLGTNICGAEGP